MQAARKAVFEELLAEHKACRDLASNDAVRFVIDERFSDWVPAHLKVLEINEALCSQAPIWGLCKLLQKERERERWNKIGQMVLCRAMHEVFESAFCSELFTLIKFSQEILLFLALSLSLAHTLLSLCCSLLAPSLPASKKDKLYWIGSWPFRWTYCTTYNNNKTHFTGYLIWLKTIILKGCSLRSTPTDNLSVVFKTDHLFEKMIVQIIPRNLSVYPPYLWFPDAETFGDPIYIYDT